MYKAVFTVFILSMILFTIDTYFENKPNLKESMAVAGVILILGYLYENKKC